MIGLKVRVAGDHHFKSNHTEGAIVEHNDLDGQLVLFYGQQFPHEHRQSAVATHRDDLTFRTSNLRSDCMRQSVGHRSVTEGSDDPAATVWSDVTCRPHVAHAGVD